MTTINSKLPYWHNQLVFSWYHHQPESHQQSLKQSSCTDIERLGPIDRTPETPGSRKNQKNGPTEEENENVDSTIFFSLKLFKNPFRLGGNRRAVKMVKLAQKKKGS